MTADPATVPVPVRAVIDGIVAGDASGPGHLVGGRCRSCAAMSFPAAAICPQCWARDAADLVPLSDRGTLYSSAVVRHAPPGFTAPYGIGCIDLAENLRIVARFDGNPERMPRPGDPVRLAVGTVAGEDTGEPVVGPVFRPLADGAGR